MEHEIKSIEQNLEIFKLKLKYLRNIGIEEPFDLEMDIMNTMPEFYENFPSIVKRLCREKNQDNTYLYKMLGLIGKIEAGEKSLESVEMNLGEELAQKFVYPLVNNLEKDKDNVNNLEKEKKE